MGRTSSPQAQMPRVQSVSRSSWAEPKAGFTSCSSACRKSARCTSKRSAASRSTSTLLDAFTSLTQNTGYRIQNTEYRI